MTYLTDLHSHMLYSVDDGAQDFAQMTEMLDLAYNDGIRTICFTPHFKLYEFENEEQIKRYNAHIEKIFNATCDHASVKYPDMRLYLGSEIMCHSDVAESISENFCRYIASSSYVLIEFQFKSSFYDMKNTVMKLSRKGYIPIIAHAERYSELVKHPERAAELKELGAIIQVNARSITNIRFGKVARFIKKLLKKGIVDIVATDSHDSKHRKPILSDAFDAVSRKYGEKYAKRLFSDNPNAILNESSKE
ncbi:MAG: hypothetical protein J6B60_01595 [Clostridia bacterium]|nr:hypothetical protein [Clostridia bacterium]